MRNIVPIKPQHSVCGVRPAAASTGARSNWLSSQPVPVSPVSVKKDLIWGVKVLLNEAKMLITVTRHCRPVLPPAPITSLPPPPFSPQHLLPAWRLSTATRCACHAAPLLQPAALLPAAPGEAPAGADTGGKGKDNTLCISYTWMEVKAPTGTRWLSQNALWRWKHFLWVAFLGSTFASSLVMAAGSPYIYHPSQNDKGQVAKKTDNPNEKQQKRSVEAPWKWQYLNERWGGIHFMYPLYVYSLCWNPRGPHISRDN